MYDKLYYGDAYMEYIRGKFKNMIFESDNGYKVGLFRIKETNQEEMNDMVNKTITFTGYFADINQDDYYKLSGKYVDNDYVYANTYEDEDGLLRCKHCNAVISCGMPNY